MSGRNRSGTTAGPVVVRGVGRRSVEFTGPHYVIVTIQRLGLRYMRSRLPNGGWLVRECDAQDLMAALEADGRRIEVAL